MAEYEILSGEKWSVVADTPEEAKAKYYASERGEDCPCGKPQWALYLVTELALAGKDWRDELCDCVNELETDTWTDEHELKLIELEQKLRVQFSADEYRLDTAKELGNEKAVIEIKARLELVTKVLGWL